MTIREVLARVKHDTTFGRLKGDNDTLEALVNCLQSLAKYYEPELPDITASSGLKGGIES